MTLTQQILLFRSCLAILVVLRCIVRDNPSLNQKHADNLQPLIRMVNDEVNRLYQVREAKK